LFTAKITLAKVCYYKNWLLLELWIGTKVWCYHGKFSSSNNAQNGGREHDEFFCFAACGAPMGDVAGSVVLVGCIDFLSFVL